MKWIAIASLLVVSLLLVAYLVAAPGGDDERSECARIVADAQRCAQCVCGEADEVRRGAQCGADDCSCQRIKLQDWKFQRLKYYYCESRY